MGKSGGEITYKKYGAENLDTIAELWQKLRLLHQERSTYFKEYFSTFTWEDRKKDLLDRAKNGAVLIETAIVNDKLIGYCVSSVNDKKAGEIESIYIEKEYRGRHIGNHFMKTALSWLDSLGVKRKIIGVAVGNEQAFRFYRKYGFYPRVTVLMQK